MPTYQYACTECGERLEAVQSFSDEPLATCPACSGRLRKVFNSVGIVFKGSGFYRTDSRKGEKSESSASSSESTSETPAKAESSTSESSSKTSSSTTSSTSSSGSSTSGSSSSKPSSKPSSTAPAAA